MAKKKEPSVEDGLNIFKDVMRRASLSNYLYVNNIMISKSPKNHVVLIIPDQQLWVAISSDQEIVNDMQELDLNKPESNLISQMMTYPSMVSDNEWMELNSEDIYKGKVIKINIDKFDYEIPINRELLPLKLKKAEANNISYGLILNPEVIMMIKKRFDFCVPECGFTLYRLFKIV